MKRYEVRDGHSTEKTFESDKVAAFLVILQFEVRNFGGKEFIFFLYLYSIFFPSRPLTSFRLKDISETISAFIDSGVRCQRAGELLNNKHQHLSWALSHDTS